MVQKVLLGRRKELLLPHELGDGNTRHFLQQQGENGIEISVVGVKKGKQSFEGLWCLGKKS